MRYSANINTVNFPGCLKSQGKFRHCQNLSEAIHCRPAERIEGRPSEVPIRITRFFKKSDPHFRFLVLLEFDRTNERILHSKGIPEIKSTTVDHDDIRPRL